jgi:hypothetical protein
MTYGYRPYPPPPPPRRRLSRTTWILIGCAIAVVLTVLLVVGIHALKPNPPRVQDSQSYQFGYNEWGPPALSDVRAGMSKPTTCNFIADLSVAFKEIPSWLDVRQAERGCADYLSQHH